MFPRLSRPSLVRAAASLALAGALLGCGPATGADGIGASGPPGATASPGGSGTTACATAPAPTQPLAGWGQPAQAPKVYPNLVNMAGQLVCGQNRVIWVLTDAGGTSVGAPDRTMSVAFYDLGRDPTKPVDTSDGTFVWAIKDARGVYISTASFPEAGSYGAEITTAAAGGQPETVRLTFDVQASSPVIHAGDAAPASKTPTLDQVGGDASKISTDSHPDAAFYKTSVDQALAKHEPFLLVFATPKFCQSAQCGPTLDSLKPYVAKYPSVTFIHVEPYKLKLVDGSLQADLDAGGQLQATATTNEWHLLSEPVVFVVNRDGIVTASFDLIFSDAELTAALNAVK